MSAKLFIGGLAWATDNDSLRSAFEKYGEVVDARVVLDRETGRSRGFGFVTYNSEDDARSAIEGMNGQDLDGRQIRVDRASDNGGSGGRGGYGGGDRRGGYGGGRGGSYGGRGGSYQGGNSRGTPYDRPSYGGRGGYGGGRGGRDDY